MMPSVTQDNQPSTDNDNPRRLVRQVAVQIANTDDSRQASLPSPEQTLRATFPHSPEVNSLNRVITQFYGPLYASTNFQLEQNITSDNRDLVQMETEHPIISAPGDVFVAHARDDIVNFPVRHYNSTGNLDYSENSLPQVRHQRANREFVPDEKKDVSYWTKRVKNNDSARRSRNKRKALEMQMQNRLLELQIENIKLTKELDALRRRCAGNNMYQSCSSKDTKKSPTLPSQLLEKKPNSFISDNLLSSEIPCAVFRKTIPSSDHGLGREIIIHAEKASYCRADIGRYTITKTESAESYTSNCDSEIGNTDPLDLTRQCNAYTSSCEALTSDGEHSESRHRRFSYKTSDNSSMEDNSGAERRKMYPLKFRWKTRMLSSHAHLPE